MCLETATPPLQHTHGVNEKKERENLHTFDSSVNHLSSYSGICLHVCMNQFSALKQKPNSAHELMTTMRRNKDTQGMFSPLHCMKGCGTER